jgi:hypothetical protein
MWQEDIPITLLWVRQAKGFTFEVKEMRLRNFFLAYTTGELFIKEAMGKKI